MTKKELLINEIEKIPESLLDDVFDFINYLKTKIVKEEIDTAVMSEPLLSKDWLRPEEEKAWQNL